MGNHRKRRDDLDTPDPKRRAAAVAALGLTSAGAPAGPDHSAVLGRLGTLVRDDPDARVRATAVAALVRVDPAAPETHEAWKLATADTHGEVRRRAAECAPQLDGVPEETVHLLLALLGDNDLLVAEAAASALAELGAETGTDEEPVRSAVVTALATVTRHHDEPLVREAAVAALGALGDPDGLPAILGSLDDRPAIRRRAVLALAPFDGPEVEAALRRALEDRDWQVRQAAEDLLGTA